VKREGNSTLVVTGSAPEGSVCAITLSSCVLPVGRRVKVACPVKSILTLCR